MATRLFVVVSAGTLLFLYKPVFTFLYGQWLKEDFNYCFIVPAVVLFLLWERRHEFITLPTAQSRRGFVLVCIGIGLFWLGELGGEFFTLYIALWLTIVGLILLTFGWHKVRAIAFPLLYALLMFPPPSVIYSNLSLNLKLLSSRIGVLMLQLLGTPAYREGNIIDLGFSRLQVVDACSGLRYLFPLLALGILIAYHYRSAWWKRMIIVLSTIPLTVITNSLRIASVGLLQPVFGPEVAEGFFHDFSGWLIFMVSVLLLVLEMVLLRKLFPEAPEQGSQTTAEITCACTHSPRSALVLQATAFILLAATGVTAATVDFRERVPPARSFVEFPLSIAAWNGTRQKMDEKYLDALHLTDYLLADFRKANGEKINLYVAFNDSQRKGESTHSPATCLPGSGWVFEESGLVDVSVNRGAFKAQRAIMRNCGEEMLVYYWFPQRGRILTSMVQLKLFAFWDGLVSRRTDGALVRLITPISNGEKPAMAEDRLRSFATEAVPIIHSFLPGF